MTLHPRESEKLIGHEEVFSRLLELKEQGHLPNGLILAGPRGIGKATLAYHFIRALLGNQAWAMIAAGSHPNILVIEPEYDPKKEEYAREISVDEVRKIGNFFSLTAADGGWRVVVIDSADALTTQAANAMLKVLEEPPLRSVLLLVAHQPDLLLPTIRSRCQTLRLTPPALEDFDRIVEYVLPQTDAGSRALLAELTELAPGLAAEYMQHDAPQLYTQMVEICGHLPNHPYSQIHTFADQLMRHQPHARWRIVTRLMLLLLSRASICAAGSGNNAFIEGEKEALARMANLKPANHWAQKWAECAEEFSIAERLHLDYKQVMIAFFHAIMSEEGFHTGMTAA